MVIVISYVHVHSIAITSNSVRVFMETMDGRQYHQVTNGMIVMHIDAIVIVMQ